MSNEVEVNDFSQGEFWCEVIDVTYDLKTCTGHVYMPAGNCTDMHSTIKIFTEHVPDISHIVTWCDGKLDTQYVLHGNDDVPHEWIAI